MVRVCFAEDCSRPHRVFGCVFHREKAVYCDDCKDARPEIFHTCRLRCEAPPIEETTHGLCPECAELLIEKMKKYPPRLIK
jgi:hypothetical protein